MERYKVGSVYHHFFYLDLKMKVLSYIPEHYQYEILVMQCPKEFTDSPEKYTEWIKGTKKFYPHSSNWKLLQNKKSPLPGWW